MEKNKVCTCKINNNKIPSCEFCSSFKKIKKKLKKSDNENLPVSSMVFDLFI